MALPGKMLAGLGALGLFALFSSKASAAPAQAPAAPPAPSNGGVSKLCGVGLCLYVQEVRPGFFEAFADRNAVGVLYPTAEMAMQSVEMPLLSYSVNGVKRKLVNFDPNFPDYVDLASNMLGI